MNKIFFLPLAKQLAERRPKNFEASCQDTLCTYVSKSRSIPAQLQQANRGRVRDRIFRDWNRDVFSITRRWMSPSLIRATTIPKQVDTATDIVPFSMIIPRRIRRAPVPLKIGFPSTGSFSIPRAGMISRLAIKKSKWLSAEIPWTEPLARESRKRSRARADLR